MKNSELRSKPHISINRHGCDFMPPSHIWICKSSNYVFIGRGASPKAAYYSYVVTGELWISANKRVV